MKKLTIFATLAALFASNAMAETTVPTWDYPNVQLKWEWTQGGSGQFGDNNNDGNLDLLLANQDKTVLYEWNNAWYGNKIFDGLNDLRYGGAQWLDYNNDGLLDFVIVACTNKDNAKGTSSVTLYKNVGGTSFEKDETNSAALAAAKVYIPVGGSIQPGRVACGDFNNDGWVDMVFSGEPADGYDHWRLTKLFWNNQGTFEADTASIEQVNNNGTYVADFDNDGFMDFIAGGYCDAAGKQVVNVFFSNGDKTFTKVQLDHGCQDGNLMVMDADNDGNQDIFVSGYGTDNGIFMLKNNGDRTFTFKSNSEIGLADSGDGAWGWASCRAYMVAGDLNNDGYNDIVTQCTWDGSNKYTYILLNNGDCTFTRNDSHGNISVRDGGISIFDFNHDGKLDVHAYGWGDDNSNIPYGEPNNWYNNIMVNSTEAKAYTAPSAPENATFEQVEGDVVLTWTASTDSITGEKGIRYNVYAKNKTTGTIVTVAPANIETGYLKFTNHGSFLNGTQYIFKGMNADEYEFGVQAINNGNVASTFTICEADKVIKPLPTWDYPNVQMKWEWTQGGSGQFGDYNNDGNLDLLLANQDKTVLYEWNNAWYGNKIFEGLNDLRYGGVQWLDYNNDGHLDFVIVACTNKDNAKGTSSVTLYKNINGTSFEKDETNSAVLAAAKVYIPVGGSIQPGRVACGDFNNDGWVDMVFSGEPADGYDHWRLTKLFWNNQGTFAADTINNIEQVNNNGTYVADFDNDGFMDFIAGGYSDSVGKQVVNVFFSNGNQTFTQLTLDHGCQDGNLLVMDADNDGNQDIFVSGYGTDNGIFMFKNNGDRTFTFKSNSEIGLADSGDGAWGWASCRAYMVAGDLDNDGFNDIVTQSAWDGSGKYTYILLNNGDCTFTRDDSHRNVVARDGGVSIFDFNHDGKLDVHVYGYGDDGTNNPYGEPNNWFNNFMVNTTDVTAYTAPAMDVAYYEQNGEDVKLTWTPACDDITGANGIRYNVYAKNKVSGEVSMVAPANIETGYLKFTNHGSFLNDTVYTFKGMNVNEYEFGVQAINNGNVASAFTICVVNLSGVDGVEAVSAVKVNTANGNIRIINNGEAANYVVYAINGVQVATGNVAANATATVNASKGIYIVKVGAQVVKVVL